MVAAVLLHFPRQRRSWADQAHLAFKDVDQLRQLINACLANKAANARNARVAFHFEHGSLNLVLLQQFFQSFLCIRHHGTELVHSKGFLILTDSCLTEEDLCSRTL
ncbi:hypothetical protein D3C84_1045090 [compost metagenome]